MDSFFKNLDKNELLEVLEAAELTKDAYLVLRPDGSVVYCTKSAEALMGSDDFSSFSHVLSERVSRVLRMAMTERATAEIEETFEERQYKIIISPVGLNTLIRLCPIRKKQNRAEVGARVESQLRARLGELMRIASNEGVKSQSSILAHEIRRIPLQMER